MVLTDIDWQTIVFWICAGILGVTIIAYFVSKRYYRMIKSYAYKIPGLKMLGKRGFPVLLLGMAIVTVSPINPYMDGWIWDWNFSSITPPIDPDPGSSHTSFNGQTKWYQQQLTFNVIPGLDRDGDYAATTYDSINCHLYRGAPNVLPGSAALYWEQQFIDDRISWDIFFEIMSLELVDSTAAASGVYISTNDVFNSGEMLYLVLGDWDADAGGNDPLKSQIFKAVVQGAEGTSAPTSLVLGKGVFYYFGQCDVNTDLTATVVLSGGGAIAATTLDWSDETDNIFDLELKITFATAEYVIQSYYDHDHGEWWDWYIVMDFYEHNSTSACDTVENLVCSMTSSNYVRDMIVINAGASATMGGHYKWAVQITTGHIYTNNVFMGEFSYETDAGGNPVEGALANHFFMFRVDLTGMTKVGSVDNSQEFQMTLDVASDRDISAIANRGAGLADGSTGEPFKQDGAATYYVVV